MAEAQLSFLCLQPQAYKLGYLSDVNDPRLGQQRVSKKSSKKESSEPSTPVAAECLSLEFSRVRAFPTQCHWPLPRVPVCHSSCSSPPAHLQAMISHHRISEVSGGAFWKAQHGSGSCSQHPFPSTVSHVALSEEDRVGKAPS